MDSKEKMKKRDKGCKEKRNERKTVEEKEQQMMQG